MKTKLIILTVFLLLVYGMLFSSCSKQSVSTYTKICEAQKKFSIELSNVSIYSSEHSEGEAGYIDRGLIAAILGDDGVFPEAMELCEEYAFFCASSLDICEAWAVRCRTYTAARDVEALFERRREYLSKQELDSESDIAAVSSAEVVRTGKYVYFAATQNSNAILEFLNE